MAGHRARLRAGTFALALALLLAGPAGAPKATAATHCGLADDTGALWIDYGDIFVPFRAIFRQPGLVVAAARTSVAQDLRAGGAHVVHWDMYLRKQVGSPAAPANPWSIVPRANRAYAHAVSVAGCATPLIGINELFGSQLKTPWSAKNSRYRANVLAFVRTLAARGARPFLFVSHTPATAGKAGAWWRELTQSADVVREVYLPAPDIYARGAVAGSRYLRFEMRRAVRDFTNIGVPSNRVGIALGFHTTPGEGGRDSLRPAAAWFEVVKLETLAAERVSTQLGLGSVWSWGWAEWTRAETDQNKPAAACVYLWTRSPRLCNGPAAAGPGFDASRTKGQAEPGAADALGVTAAPARGVAWLAITSGPQLAGRVAVVQQRAAAGGAWAPAHALVLAPQIQRVRLVLRTRRALIRVVVTREAAPGGHMILSTPLLVQSL